jgi:hypothetical protein
MNVAVAVAAVLVSGIITVSKWLCGSNNKKNVLKQKQKQNRPLYLLKSGFLISVHQVPDGRRP